MIKLIVLTISSLLFVGCASKYDSSIHKPKVRFKPSVRALDRLKSETMGHPYVWGAENDGMYDCSGLTYYTFGSMGVDIPRVANQQFHSGTPVSRDELQKGDLVFFATSKRRPGVATHVGIYLGNGMFQHASSAKKRVVVSSLNKPYYASHYLGARRYYAFNTCKTNNSFFTIKHNAKPKKSITISTPQPLIAKANNIENSEESNPFVQTDSSEVKEQSSNHQTKDYKLVIPTQEPNALITKLQLSGLDAHLDANGEVVIDGFSSRSDALNVKANNYVLLANAIVKG